MGRLVLIRHGQASYGQADYDRLSPTGEQQARAVGPALASLGLDALFMGPHRRHAQTMAGARETPGLPEPQLLDELAEYPAFDLVTKMLPRLVAEDPEFAALATAPNGRARDAKALANRAFHRILHAWARDEWHVEGVERVTEFAARVRRGLEMAIAGGRKVGVVTSAGPIGVAVGLAYGVGEHRMVRTSVVVRNASISELVYRSASFAWEPEQVSLLTFNSVGHLPPELHTEY